MSHRRISYYDLLSKCFFRMHTIHCIIDVLELIVEVFRTYSRYAIYESN